MKDYIEREYVLKCMEDSYKNAGISAEAKAKMTRWLNKAPAADVRPVVRGKWVKARGSWCTPGGDPVWECSECGKGRHVYGIEHGSYGAGVADGQWVACPNCGAWMEES